MKKIFKILDGRLEEIETLEENTWIYMENPTEEECRSISQEFEIPIDFLLDPLDPNERPRIEVEDEAILIVFRVPIREGDSSGDIVFYAIPIGIVFVGDKIITITTKKTEVFEQFIKKNIKTFTQENKISFLLPIFLRSTLLYLKYLKEINTITEKKESKLQKTMRNDELMDLLNLQKSLVYFNTSLKANELIMEKLKKGRIMPITEDEEDFLEDIIIDNRQAIEMTSIYSDILRDMMNAFSSIISNNLNIVMKFLTSITLILTIPTLIASIYGMNVALPMEHYSHAFAIIIGISIVLSTITMLLFKRKGLL